MIIEIDAGNTRLKWRSRSRSGEVGGALIAQSAQEIAETIARNSSTGETARVDAVRIASVRSPDSLAALVAECEQLFSVSPVVAKVVPGLAGVQIQYSDPARLGVDRWLAMLAAKARVSGACLVVDSGTALTIDQLNDEGGHEGGYILPGLELMCRSLEQNTRIRLNPDFGQGNIGFGHSTDAAVYQGCLAAAVALVKTQFLALRGVNAEARLILTGGGAAALLPHLAEEGAEWVPDLVLDGLAPACAES